MVLKPCGSVKRSQPQKTISGRSLSLEMLDFCKALAVTLFGMFDKETIVRQMSEADLPFKSATIDDAQVVVLSPESLCIFGPSADSA